MRDAWSPLAGVRVLDLSRLLPGPFLTQLLADLGADVVKVESPSGDDTRHIPPEVEGVGHAFLAVNRGKRSVAMDLRAPGAADAVLRLAARADVLVESFRPGVLERWGLSDDALASANPRLVRLSLVGYPDGPWRDEPGHDINYQSLAGILAMQGAPEAPAPSAAQVADIAGALYGAAATLAALIERERSGRGRRIEVALADAAVAFHAMHLERAASGDDLPARGEWELAGGLPGYGIYRCGDGRFLALGALEAKFWARFCEAVARPDLMERQLDRDARADVAQLLLARGRDEWARDLAKAGVPATPVLEASEAAALHRGRMGPGMPLTGRSSTARAPALGEHTDEVLREAGLSASDIERLRADGVVA